MTTEPQNTPDETPPAEDDNAVANDTPTPSDTDDPSPFAPEVLAIAERLQEKDKKPIGQLQKIIELCGLEFTELMTEAAVQIDADEGILTADGNRRRTLGGVFFYLVRGAVSEEYRDKIFPFNGQQKARNVVRLSWVEDRHQVIESKHKRQHGRVSEVEIAITGSIKRYEIYKDNNLVLVTMEDRIGEEQPFPLGVIQPPTGPVAFYVYISLDQWNRTVSKPLRKDPKLALNVKGAVLPDAKYEHMAVFARHIKVVSSSQMDKMLKRREENEARRRENEAAIQAEKAKRDAERAAEKAKDPLNQYPEEFTKKLRPLYGARNLFQKRLADIEALPADKQSGLKTAQMMLERTEQQIAALEQQAREAMGE